MHDLSLPKRIYYRYLGYLYWFTHYTSTYGIFGVRFSMIIKLLAIILVLAAWLLGWGNVALLISLVVFAWIFLAYWRAGRRGYFRFVADKPTVISSRTYEDLAHYKRVSCIASGIFSVQNWEKNVLFRPTDYWQAPGGDHGLMVEHRPHRFLYQFFNVASMHELRRGWLLYGSIPRPALMINYSSIWGPESLQVQYSIFGSERKQADPILRTIYLSFTDNETEEIICDNILNDVQRHRESEQTAEAAN